MLQDARGGIRTHEAEAVDLKSTPFDRSGTLAEFSSFLGWNSALPIELIVPKYDAGFEPASPA